MKQAIITKKTTILKTNKLNSNFECIYYDIMKITVLFVQFSLDFFARRNMMYSKDSERIDKMQGGTIKKGAICVKCTFTLYIP